MKRNEPKTAQDYIQEAENFKAMIKLAKTGIAFCLVILLVFLLGTLAGCTNAAKDTVTAPSTFRVMDDMGAYDDYVVAMCQAQSVEVTLSLVKQAPEEFSLEEVENIMGYLYQNCIRDNGRST